MNSKARIAVSQIIEKIELIAGIMIAAFFALVGIICLPEEEGVGIAITCLVFVIIGIFLVHFSRKRHKLIVDFKKYVTAISADGSGSIEKLSRTLNVAPDVVRNNLDLMIKKKYFVNAFINEETNGIVIGNIIPRKEEAVQSVNKTESTQQNFKRIEYMSVTCPGCGGINKVEKGKSCGCEYCGSPLNS